MAYDREGHTATLLPYGDVLITGGESNAILALKTAELYDSTKGTFKPTGNLIQGRRNHTATLLPSGRVLVAGGLSNSDSDLATAELYTPKKRIFNTTST